MKFRLVEAMTTVQDTLNPVLWDSTNQLKRDIKKKIIELVEEFTSTLDIPLKVLDINIVGSNASYNYNKKSDIDVHIITNFDDYGYPEELVQAAMNSFKAHFNSKYDVKYKGYDVEIYVEDVKSSPQSNGIYSVLRDEWIKEPVKLAPVEVELEPELSECKDLIDDALKSNNIEQINSIIDDLYILRRNSLVSDGEFSAGNLIFKQIRNDGLLDALKDKRIELASKELSVESWRRKLKIRKLFEAYNIPRSGYVIVDEDNELLSREFAYKETNNMRRMFTDNILDACVFQDEYEARKYVSKLYQFFEGEKDFYVQHVESNKEQDNQAVSKHCIPIIRSFSTFVLSAMELEKLAGGTGMEQFFYTEDDYNNNKKVPSLLVAIVKDPDSVLPKIQNFYTTVVKKSGLEDNDSTLVDSAKKYVNGWNELIATWKQIPSNFRYDVVEILQKVGN